MSGAFYKGARMDEFNNYPTRRPLFSVWAIIITTLPLVVMIVGTIRLLILGSSEGELVGVGGKILLHLIFCSLGAPFASLISILASYFARERGESLVICKNARVYAKAVMFSCLAFLAILVIISVIV